MDTLELPRVEETAPAERSAHARAVALFEAKQAHLEREYPGHCALVVIHAIGEEVLVAENITEAWTLFKDEMLDSGAAHRTTETFAFPIHDGRERPAVAERDLSDWYRRMRKPGKLTELLARKWPAAPRPAPVADPKPFALARIGTNDPVMYRIAVAQEIGGSARILEAAHAALREIKSRHRFLAFETPVPDPANPRAFLVMARDVAGNIAGA